MQPTDLRSQIFQLVSTIPPTDDLEAHEKEFVLQWINSGVEIFRIQKPDTPPIHLVSYFVVVSPNHDQVLLVDHKRAGLWLPAGGHVEPGEHPKETVIREVREELGIEADFIFNDPIFVTVGKTVNDEGTHTDISLWYVLKADPEQSLHYDTREFHGIRWFTLDTVPIERIEPHMRRFITKLASYQESNV